MVSSVSWHFFLCVTSRLSDSLLFKGLPLQSGRGYLKQVVELLVAGRVRDSLSHALVGLRWQFALLLPAVYVLQPQDSSGISSCIVTS